MEILRINVTDIVPLHPAALLRVERNQVLVLEKEVTVTIAKELKLLINPSTEIIRPQCSDLMFSLVMPESEVFVKYLSPY